MDFLEKLNYLMKKKSLNKHKLSQISDVPYTTIDGFYKKGYENTKLSTIRKLAYALDVSLDYLIVDSITDEDYGKTSGFTLDINEMESIKKYRALDEHGKEIVNLVVDRELQRTQVIASLKKQLSEMEAAAEYMSVIPLRVSTQKVAAGNGVYLGPEDFDIIKVQETELTRMANFAVPVSGDSMEPKFHDGDILLVGEELPEIGDIGIFTMDGYGYVKQRGENELISLNLQYPPIPMKDSIISNGKVIGVLRFMS